MIGTNVSVYDSPTKETPKVVPNHQGPIDPLDPFARRFILAGDIEEASDETLRNMFDPRKM